MSDPAVAIIIPTRGLSARYRHLLRAVASVTAQRQVHATPVVVVNGQLCAPEVERFLQDSNIATVYLREPGIASALRAGRMAVDAPWFGTLDDDDELLPDALAQRLRVFDAQPDVDIVVTNGLQRSGTTDTLHVPPDLGNRIARDAQHAFLERNWLLPGSWLARSDRVGASLFDGMPAFRECTFLALRFSTEYRMRWLQEPTVLYHVGSPHAVSHSAAYQEGQIDAVRALLALRLSPRLRRRVHREISGALHDAADRLWQDDDLSQAWRMHLRSLAGRWGVRYLPFTRHLLAAEVTRVFARVRSAVS